MKLFLSITTILSILFLSACSDNPTESDTEHLDAVGLRIVSSGQTLVEYIRDAATVGEIEVEEGALSPGMDIEFYNDETGEWVTPNDNDYSLNIEIEDTNIAQYWQHEGEEGGFEFHVRGKEEGHTHVIFSILHDGHSDFVSREIEIHVEHGDGSSAEMPEGLHLIKEASGDTLASWDEHDGVDGNAIQVANGMESGHIEVAFFSHDGDEINLNSSDFFLEFAVANTAIANIEQHDLVNEPWAFEVEGLSVGSTTFTIKLKENHDDHSDLIFETGEFTINIQ